MDFSDLKLDFSDHEMDFLDNFWAFWTKKPTFSEKRANGLFTEFCSPEGHFLCIPVYEYNFVMMTKFG